MYLEKRKNIYLFVNLHDVVHREPNEREANEVKYHRTTRYSSILGIEFCVFFACCNI